ncbi:hypothetical protein PMAYCL1PPCAC_08078, partial [Pristionchus mayeri]
SSQVNVDGAIVCDTENGREKALLSDVVVQLREYNNPFEADSLDTYVTKSDGEFIVSGSSAEWDDEFFIEVKVPCWGKQIQRCDN